MAETSPHSVEPQSLLLPKPLPLSLQRGSQGLSHGQGASRNRKVGGWVSVGTGMGACQFTWPKVDLMCVWGSPRPQGMRAHRGERAGVHGTQHVCAYICYPQVCVQVCKSTCKWTSIWSVWTPVCAKVVSWQRRGAQQLGGRSLGRWGAGHRPRAGSGMGMLAQM